MFVLRNKRIVEYTKREAERGLEAGARRKKESKAKAKQGARENDGGGVLMLDFLLGSGEGETPSSSESPRLRRSRAMHGSDAVQFAVQAPFSSHDA
jgi:hypothetical protein